MKPPQEQRRLRKGFILRLWVAAGAMALLLLLLCGRLLYLQWMQHAGLLLESDRNRMDILPELPVRGRILDRNGVVLADNRPGYRLELIPERVERLDATLNYLAGALHWSERRLKRIRRRIARSRPDRPVLLQDKLSWPEAAPIASRQHHWPGIQVTASSLRVYPLGPLTAHAVGYLAVASAEDLRRGYHSGEYVGRSGVERTMEQRLRGKPGYRIEEVDAHGRRLRTLLRTPPQDGRDLRLSIDLRLQQTAAHALGGRTGAVVVLEVESGRLLVLLSKPGFDPNAFITGMTPTAWRRLRDDPRNPLLDRAIQAAYPPASTMKLITAISGLEHHIPLARATDQCSGHIELADRTLRCWKKSGHGTINLTRAIAESCDIYFYHLGEALGISRMRQTAQEWGLGAPTGVELPAEARGYFPGATPRMARRRWYQGETMITAIGQGRVTATPIQIARLAAAIANGGKLLRPTLLADSAPQIVRRIAIDPRHLRYVRRAMHRVVSAPHGTAHTAFLGARIVVAGKTGTAQVVHTRRDARGKPRRGTVRFAERDHAWFMGFAPFDAPRIAFAIFIEHGGHGGSAAAPVARAIVDRYFRDHPGLPGRKAR
ncbi:MAG: penicillin-binding protein 2 [Zetaproteobacteria bacterium]|nr:MAG: penicillin-binding protein 2 [Zetaproteobacteria bacterium]